MFLVIALEFFRKLMKKMMQEFCQVLNDNRESLDELKNFNKIKNVSIRVFIMFVNENVSSDLNEDELES